MKKIISVLAMALLVAGAAQAQVRKMIVHMNNDSIVKIIAADIQEVTFEMDYTPNTIEEAQAILLDSYWKVDSQLDDEFYDNYDCAYITIAKDPEIIDPMALYWVKVKDSPSDEYYAPYAGKIVLSLFLGYVGFKAPTEFIIFGDGISFFKGTHLEPDSFDLTRILEPVTWHCVRIDPFDPSEVTIIPDSGD